MEYKRLTDRQTAEMLKNTEGLSLDSDLAEAQRYISLAELEDKIENGTLVELPCNVGDKFYVAYESTKEYEERECCGFSVVDGRVEVINEVDGRYYADEVCFSKEDAEARLELRGKA